MFGNKHNPIEAEEGCPTWIVEGDTGMPRAERLAARPHTVTPMGPMELTPVSDDRSQEIWERAFFVAIGAWHITGEHPAEIADAALEAWKKRWKT
jgi:hypothetical protein